MEAVKLPITKHFKIFIVGECLINISQTFKENLNVTFLMLAVRHGLLLRRERSDLVLCSLSAFYEALAYTTCRAQGSSTTYQKTESGLSKCIYIVVFQCYYQ